MYYIQQLRAERNGKPKVEVIDDDPMRDSDIMAVSQYLRISLSLS